MTGHTHKLNKQQVHDLLEEGKLCLTGMNQRVPDLRRAEECFRLVMKDCGDVDARAEYYLVQPIWSWRTIAMGWTNPDVPVEDTIATQAISALFTRLGELVNFDQTDMDAVQQLFLIVVLYSSVLDPEPRAPNDSTDMIQQFLCRARLGRFRDATRALTTAVDRWAWKKKLETMKTPATTHKKRRQQRQRRVRTVMEIEEVVDLLSMWVGIHISAMHTLRFAMKEKHGLWEDKCEYWGWTLPWLECNDAIPDLINWASAHLAKFADVRSCQSHSLSVLSLQVLDDVRRESERGNRLIWRIAVEWRIRMRYCDHAANPDGPETQNLPNIPNQNFLSSNQSTTNTIAQLLREGDQGKNLCFLKRWWDATCTLSGDHYTWSDQQLAVKALLDQTDLPLYDEVIADDGDGHVWVSHYSSSSSSVCAQRLIVKGGGEGFTTDRQHWQWRSLRIFGSARTWRRNPLMMKGSAPCRHLRMMISG